MDAAPIYKPTGNSHVTTEPNANPDGVIMEEKKEGEAGEEVEEEEVEVKKKSSGGGRKEKSVLQAKLTKLAIQIGYAGMSYVHQYSHLKLSTRDWIFG